MAHCVEVEIERMSYGPAAVGRYIPPGSPEGTRPVVIFVRGALPNERARVRIVKQHKNYWEAELVEVLRPSPDRVTPPCPIFGRCGGCQWQHLAYPAQVREKAGILVHQLQRATGLGAAELEAKLKVHPAASPFGYRARLQARGAARGLGFYREGSHEIIATDTCLVAHPDIQKAWTTFLRERPLDQLASATGTFKVEWTRTATGQVQEAINRKHSAFGFTQVNPEQNVVLTQVVRELATPAPGQKRRLLLDLYGGDGNLAHGLTDLFEVVVSVDSENAGVDPSEIKAPLKPGHLLIRSSVESFLDGQYWRDWGFESVDCIVADPPRNGMREAVGALSRLSTSRIVLVSCDPSTLARDLAAFVQPRSSVGGSGTSLYQVDSVHLIDMFPQTFHMEAVIGCSSTTRLS